MTAQALRKVFRNPVYILIALAVSFTIFAFATWLPNLRLISDVVSSSSVILSDKFMLLVSLLGALSTNFTWLSGSVTVIISILLGVYVAMLSYFFRHRVIEAKEAGTVTGILGLFSAMLGVGCAACGSFLFSGALSVVGAAGLLALLPLGGEEFGLIGIILLLISVRAVSKKITQPAVCKI
jgi:hypothetical protein